MKCRLLTAATPGISITTAAKQPHAANAMSIIPLTRTRMRTQQNQASVH
jgi:hypothetical protein